LAPNKRGSHLALSLERLSSLCGGGLQRIGLSATQKPIEEVACFLVGAGSADDPGANCLIVDSGHYRERDLELELPSSPLEAVMSADVWDQVYDRLSSSLRPSHYADLREHASHGRTRNAQTF
jgi:ATP-dependent Lhr-like helicase